MSIHNLVHSHFTLLFLLMFILMIVLIIRSIKKQKRTPKELTDTLYGLIMNDTFTEVQDIEKNMFNIWPFVNDLKNAQILPKNADEKNMVYKVYTNSNQTYQHILLHTETPNEYILIIANWKDRQIKGYRKIIVTNQTYGAS